MCSAPSGPSFTADIQNSAIPDKRGYATLANQVVFMADCCVRKMVHARKAMSPLMWISLKPVEAHEGHASSPVKALSQGNTREGGRKKWKNRDRRNKI